MERNHYRKIVSKDTVAIPIGDGDGNKAKAGKPDFVVVDVARPLSGLVPECPPPNITMRHVPAVIEVKAKATKLPIR